MIHKCVFGRHSVADTVCFDYYIAVVGAAERQLLRPAIALGFVYFYFGSAGSCKECVCVWYVCTNK